MLDRARPTPRWTPRADWAPRTLYLLAAALGVASLALALWGFRAARTFDDQLARAARVQAEVLAREFTDEVRAVSGVISTTVFSALNADRNAWGRTTPQRVLNGVTVLKDCRCAPVVQASGGAFWWTASAPDRLVVIGVDSTQTDALRRKLIKSMPASSVDQAGTFILKADDDGRELLALTSYRLRNGVAEAAGFLTDPAEFVAIIMRPAAWGATERRFGEAGAKLVGWRVIRPGGDTSVTIGAFDASAPALSVAFFRPRFRADSSAEGDSFVAPLISENHVASAALANTDTTPPDPRTAPYRLIVQIDPAALGEVLYGTRRGPTLPILILLVVTLVLTAATLLLARRFLSHVREREAFATAVAHDLRTPLTQILLYGESLQLNRPAIRAREEAARVIVRETRRLIHLVENALQFVRGERARPSLHLRPLDLGRVVRETLEGLGPILDRAGVQSHLVVPGDVWVHGDRDALAQVITNIVDNAVRFGPRGQTLQIALHTEQNRALLTCDDQGPGIPPAMRQEVFKPFVREGNSQGSGIGLAVSRQLIELMDGTLEVMDAPAPHGGARFIITLTRALAIRADRPATSDASSIPEYVP